MPPDRDRDRNPRPRERSRSRERERDRNRRGRSRSPARRERERSEREYHQHNRSRSRSPRRARSRSGSRQRDRDGKRSPSRALSRSRSRERSRRKRSRSRSSSSSSSEDDRRRKRRRDRSRSRSRSRERKEKKDKKKRDKNDKKDKKKKDKKDKKDKKKKTKVASEWGKYGTITESDLFTKDEEFRAWLLEEQKINPETISKDQTRKQFVKFVEDYNTGTLPHEKYYNMRRFETRMALLRSGETLPPDDVGYDFNADMVAHTSAIKRGAPQKEASFSKAELEELRRVQNERVQLSKMKVLGMDIKTNMGMRMVADDSFDPE